jgi:PST family polysaccharide transporter
VPPPPALLHNVPWSFLSYATTRIFTLVTSLILARLLAPTDFGLVGLALLGVSAINAVAELGLSNTVLQRSHSDRRTEGTQLTLLTIFGVAGALLGVLLAPALAGAFGEPRLEPVVRAMSLLVLISGPTTFFEALMRRSFAFRTLFWCSFGASAAQLVLATLLAMAGAGVWSIVAGQAAFRVGSFVLMQALTPVKVRPAWDRRIAVESLRSGGGFLGQAAVWFVQSNIDYVVVGRTFNAAAYGLYQMSYRLGELPAQAIGMPLARVTFPAYTALLAQGRDPLPTYLRSLRYLALLALPAGALLSGAAEPFVVTVLGRAWAPMAGVLAILGIWGAVEALQSALTWWFNGQGLQRLAATRSFVILLPSIPAFVLAATTHALTAVAAVILGRVLVMYGSLLVIGQRRAGVTVSEQMRAIWPAAAGAAGAWLVSRGAAVAIASPAVGLAAGIGLGLVAYLTIVRLTAPGLPAEAFGHIRRLVRKADAGAVAP